LIRVLVCDDQAVVRQGLQAMLESCPHMDVVGLAQNGQDAVEKARVLMPDIVLMDLKMPVKNGIQATRQLRQELPGIKVLALTTYDGEEWVFDAIRAGACGYLLKDSPRERLIEAIQEVAQGRTPVDPAVAGKLFRAVASPSSVPATMQLECLSHREREILGLLAQGHSNAQIAHVIFLSEGTVRNHVSSLLEKLGVKDRTQAAILAMRHGMGMPIS
jgi:DNA-binding NarL/FixJ family response regulator